MEHLTELVDNEHKGAADKKRRSSWPKMIELFLRIFHVGTSSVLFGGFVWAVPYARLSAWHHLTIVTGSAMILNGMCRSRHWTYQGRGLVAGLHVGLLWFVHNRTGLMLPLLWSVLVVGIIGSHLPGSIRHWSLLHGRRVD